MNRNIKKLFDKADQQIMIKEEKKKELKKIYNNQLLRETLKNDVIKLDGRLPRVFWRVLKIRCYPLCSILLRCNAQN